MATLSLRGGVGSMQKDDDDTILVRRTVLSCPCVSRVKGCSVWNLGPIPRARVIRGDEFLKYFLSSVTKTAYGTLVSKSFT